MDEKGTIFGPGETEGSSGRPSSPSSPQRDVRELGEGVRLVRLGDLHFSADQFSNAQTYYERALALLDSTEEFDYLTQTELKIAECLRRRGQLDNALVAIRRAQESLGASPDPVLEGKIWAREAQICVVRGDYQGSLRLGLQAYERLRSSNEHEELAVLEHTLGRAYNRLGEVEKAQEAFKSALYSFRRIGHREGVARCLNNLGLLLKNTPRWNEAKDAFSRALTISEELGHYARVGFCSLNLAILETKIGEWAQAQTHINRAFTIAKDINNLAFLTKVHLAAGWLRHRLGQAAQAEYHFGEALTLATQHAFHRERLLAIEFQSDLHLERSSIKEAGDLLVPALADARKLAPRGDMVAELAHRLAHVEVERGNLRDAYSLAWESISISHHLEYMPDMGAGMGVLAQVLEQSGVLESAGRIYAAAVEILENGPDILERTILQVRYAKFIIRSVRLFGASDEGQELHRAWRLLDAAFRAMEKMDLSPKSVELMAEIASLEGDAGRLAGALEKLSRAYQAAERIGRVELVESLEKIRTRLEEQSAEDALLDAPELRAAEEWNLVWMGSSGSERISRVLEFALGHIRSDRGFLAFYDHGKPMVENVSGLPRRTAEQISQRIWEYIRPEAGRHLCLATDLTHDPRFVQYAGSHFADVRSLVALRLDIAGQHQGLLYLDRGLKNLRGSYGDSDVRLLSLVGSLASMALADRVRQRETANDRENHFFTDFITRDPKLRRSLKLLERIQSSDVTILLMGETGTGKGLLARCIHDANPTRRDGPFLQVNCAALPETLLESELFGFVKGAFTGATQSRKGLFEEAEGGTLFLDEVDKTSPTLQAKLLHVLDQREIRPVGSNKWSKVNARVLCATNAQLRESIEKGEFLEDLYYRMNDFIVTIPPLRDRREDIPLLVEHFFQRSVAEMHRAPRGISRKLLRLFMDAPWRGNVRELEKMVKRLVVLAEDGAVIAPDLLPADFINEPVELSGEGLKGELSRLERRVIEGCLREVDWNRSEAARRLKISYPNLLKKIKIYKIRKG
ncbi:MAG: sigma 54-interacting transcriptional regulator [Candidatus Eisenbacteria bacterium]|uniref:Sigma 54-interacting transcriptional regulator n=1 Tax=Eiseniibacteriota bacterium TaxID=2212470 RepID=A0A948W6S7_UNCEI|nr:sigma 54-interacting transcriptional regulator [Candidatus Eisenbacteria bacterium]MBU1947300.1 sigma 54-interacting transcriptional regulator [Candidatus Eisenbacteria bacterium]MBU2691839.1 sigma 54-interacting transcriptional regulator [Candidatus Eisenbacteria bacterium]